MAYPLVSRELVFRLEAAEAAYTEAKLVALRADSDNSRGVETARIGRSTLLSIQSRRNNPSYNRAFCFASEDLQHLDGILHWLRDRTDCFWLDAAPALLDVASLDALARADLYPSFTLNVVFTVPRMTSTQALQGVLVRELHFPDRAHDFAVALSGGFGVPPELLDSTERSAQIEYAAQGWHVYLATIDGEPASMATLYVDGELAAIDAMATVPRYRRRGCQSALLRLCIGDAARAGCALLASQTQPSSTSERNMVRAGFRIAYTKMLYTPRMDPSTHE